jgi:hypothetical protein
MFYAQNLVIVRSASEFDQLLVENTSHAQLATENTEEL